MPAGRPKGSPNKQKYIPPAISTNKAMILADDYVEKINTDKQYSLAVDPENKYNMPVEQKNFIKYYIDFKNIPAAARLADIDTTLAEEFYKDYGTQQEIRRISMAMYHRQFATRLANLDEIGGYLTSLLMDFNVPIADRLKGKEKIKVVDLLIKVNEAKRAAVENPEMLDVIDIEDEIKEMNVKDLKKLIESTSSKQKPNLEKLDLINRLKETGQFTPEEMAYIETLPEEKLKEILGDK